MKKSKKILGLICILIILLIVFVIRGKRSNEVSYISGETGIDVTQGEVTNQYDTHGGFHGDGIKCVEISFDGKGLELSQLEEKWKLLPLSSNLQLVIYGAWKVFDTENNQDIPEITNGYYYFYDRFEDSSDPLNDSELLERSSYNFTLAIYDADSQILYYCEVDT